MRVSRTLAGRALAGRALAGRALAALPALSVTWGGSSVVEHVAVQTVVAGSPDVAPTIPTSTIPTSTIPTSTIPTSTIPTPEAANSMVTASASTPGPDTAAESAAGALTAAPSAAAPSAGTVPPGIPGAPSGKDPAASPEEVLNWLFDPLLRRLRAELLIERDRRGVRTDRWR
ncbi:MAG: hypothetical protein JXA67_19765 [Micromonosporaceae bacterium]|nr:hypothetical protein [Micromonosporaceae bacterium]